MTQKTIITIGVTALLASTLVVAIALSTPDRRPRGLPEESQYVSVKEHESLRKRYDSALARLRGMEARVADYERASQETEPGHTVATGNQDEKSPAKPTKANPKWSAMGKLIGENVSLLVEAAELLEEGKPYPQELKKRLAGFASQLVLHGIQVRGLSKFPYLDRAFYGDMLTGIAKEALHLSEDQLQQLSATNQATFDELLGDADPAELLPLERHWLRNELSFRTHETIIELLQDSKLEKQEYGDLLDNWRTLKRLSHQGPGMIMGMPPVKDYGFQAPDVGQQVLTDWQHDYSLTDHQVEAMRGPANEYVRRAREVVERFGGTEEEIASLSYELQIELRRDLLELQVQEELRVVSNLNESQREAVEQERPTIRRFDFGLETRVKAPSLLQNLDSLFGK